MGKRKIFFREGEEMAEYPILLYLWDGLEG